MQEKQVAYTCIDCFYTKSLPQVKKPIINKTTFKIMVMADNGNGTKLDSMIPNPEILLTEV